MVNDSAVLAEILAPTWLGDREITSIALQNDEVVFSVSLERGEQVLPAWEAGRSVVHETGRWPALSPGYGAPRLNLRERRDRRLNDPAGRDAHIELAARDAIREIRHARDKTWPPEPLEQRIDAHLRRTRSLVGAAPEPTEVLSALPPGSTEIGLERWLLEWEDAQGTSVPASRDRPSWMFWPDEPLLFFPTDSGPETLAYHPPFQGVAGATVERVMTLLEWWEQRYGAELVANHGTIIDFIVLRPPRTLDESWEIAVQQELIAPDTLWLPGIPLREHARALINHPAWSIHERP